MQSKHAFVALAMLLVLSLVSCTLGLQRPSTSPLDAAATIVAMTMSAAGLSTAPGSVATAVPSTVPVTPTTKPVLTINTNDSKCRSGPGSNFKVVSTFSAGTTVDMIAKDTADGYWLVRDPNTGSSCWVQAQDATPSGSFDLLPEVTPQAASGQNAPAKPGSSSAFNYWEYQCGVGTVTVTLRWLDAANNENGYHVYRNGELIADLPAGSTSYTDSPSSGGSLSYSIAAYNDVGESPPLKTPDFSC